MESMVTDFADAMNAVAPPNAFYTSGGHW